MYLNHTHELRGLEELTEELAEETAEEQIAIGVVVDCDRLNIRELPSLDAAILCEVKRQDTLMIDEDESTNEFYKVYTVSGLEGFGMRKFIAIED